MNGVTLHAFGLLKGNCLKHVRCKVHSEKLGIHPKRTTLRHFGRSVTLSWRDQRTDNRLVAPLCCQHSTATATRTINMAQHAVRTSTWKIGKFVTNIPPARRHARPPHPPKPEARRPKHPHYISRERSHRAHLRPHIQILIGESEQRPSSFLT
jgi:hypothetical protein